MTILRDRSIRDMIENEVIGCRPQPNWETQLQPASLDLRLGNEYAKFTKSPSGIHAPIVPGKTEVDKLMTRFEANSVLIKPGQFLLGTTLEWVSIPPHLVARVEGRSSLARVGLVVHVTAGFIDPGFHGCITLEMVNHGHYPVKLAAGTRICQLCFEQLDAKAEKPYGGKYQNQASVTASRTHLDEEAT